MRLIGGVLRLDGEPADGAVAAAMARAMTAPGLAPRLAWRADGPVLLAVLDFGGGGGPDGFAAGPDGSLAAADIRLDRPGEAAARLGLPASAPAEGIALAAADTWGEALPDRLDGDYALATWHPGMRRLTLARDIFGVRPLCTALLPGRLFAFASLPKGLHGSGLVPPRPDLLALGRQVVLGPLSVRAVTGYRDIAWLPAGHVMTIEAGGACRTVRGWHPDPATVGTWRGGHEEAAAILRNLVREAVEARVPATGGVASHLSGGLDSSAVAVLAARRLAATGRRLLAFAYLPGAGTDPALDRERPFVDAILAEERTIDCTEIHFAPDSAVPDIDPDLPLIGLGLERQIQACEAAAAAGVGLFLTGAGGDEGATYNGATMHADLVRAGRIGAVLADLPARSRREGRPLSRIVLARLIRPFLPAWMTRTEHRLRGWRRPFDSREALALLAPDLRAAIEPGLPHPPGPWSNRPEHRVAMLVDSYLHPRNDVWALLGARYGLAFAHPLLDRRIVDFTLGLPLERFLHGGHSRQPFRDAMAGILPDRVRFAGLKLASVTDPAVVLPAVTPELRAGVRALRSEPAAAALLDVSAVEATVAALPDRPRLEDVRHIDRAGAVARALALVRHLARLEGSSADPQPVAGKRAGLSG